MGVPTGSGNYPQGVTDNDPHFEGDNLCEHCEEQPKWRSDLCKECYDVMAEAEYDRRMEDGEQFRGGEAAAYSAEQQAWIQRNLK